MRARSIRLAAALQALLLMATLVLPGLVVAAEISTDLWVYNDGDTVTVTGVEFGAHEAVDLVTTDPAGTVVDIGSADTDDTGGFVYQFTLNATVPGIYDIVATGRESGLVAATQFDPPSITITFPASTAYRTSTWDAGCSTVGGDMCGSVVRSGSATLQSISYSLRQGSGNYWNGASFGSAAEMTFSLFAGSTTSSQPWSIPFPISNFPADGAYTLKVYAVQSAQGTNSDSSVSFTIDRNAPTTTINPPNIQATNIDASGTIADTTSGPVLLTASLYSGSCPGTTLIDSDTDSSFPSGNWAVGNLGPSGLNAPGTYCLRAVGTDAAGNVQSPATEREFVIDEAPSIVSTTPADGATGVPVGSDIDIDWDEGVTLDANAITVECPAGTPIAGVISGSGSSHSFNPTADLPANTVCVVTVHFNRVHDIDVNDPPDEMANPNHVFSFTTASANTPPDVDAGGPYSGDEGEAIAISGSADDDDGDVLTYLWSIDTTGIDAGGTCSFGDATALDTTVTCDDDSNGSTFTLTLTVSGDPDGDVTDTADLTVANVAPTVELDAGNPTSVTESEDDVIFNYVADDAGDNDTITTTIDCGAAGSYIAGSDTGSSFKCEFLDGGGPVTPATSSDVSIYVTDDEGADSATDTQTVDIANANPVVAAPYFTTTQVCQGSTATLSGISFSDAGVNDDPWAINIDWGDGSADYQANVNDQGGQSDVSPTFNYPGTYSAVVTVTDKDGGEGTNTSSNSIEVVPHYAITFRQPVDGTTTGSVTNAVKLGRVVPVKVVVWDNCANNFAGAYVTDPSAIVRIAAGLAPAAGGTLLDSVEAYADAGSANNNTLLFRWTSDASAPGGGFWIYNLDTKNSMQMQFVLGSTYRIDAYINGFLASGPASQYALLRMQK